ncbi:MAG: hypothetical protein WC156_10300 [Pedobacter sp.]
MLIQIEYYDNKFDFVKNYQLDSLLEKQKVHRFKRSSGWVTVGIDPIRTRKNVLNFDDPERRNKNPHT